MRTAEKAVNVLVIFNGLTDEWTKQGKRLQAVDNRHGNELMLMALVNFTATALYGMARDDAELVLMQMFQKQLAEEMLDLIQNLGKKGVST